MENILLDPYLLLCEVFTDELCKHIANETNNYYHQTLAAIQNKNNENINIFSTYPERIKRLKNLSMEEITAFYRSYFIYGTE